MANECSACESKYAMPLWFYQEYADIRMKYGNVDPMIVLCHECILKSLRGELDPRTIEK